MVCATEEDKFLLLFALLKLALIRGKALLFVNTLERSYRLRLFLEQFSVPTCVLNGELPLRSRCAQPQGGKGRPPFPKCLQARLWAWLIL